jgi:hypothetical protein
VAGGVIEFRARMLQVQTIARAMLVPGLNQKPAHTRQTPEGLGFQSVGYRAVSERESPETPISADQRSASPALPTPPKAGKAMQAMQQRQK